MQKVVIGCLVFLAAFGIGSFLGYDASSRHPVAKALDNLRQSRRAVRPKFVRDSPVEPVEMYGDWVSTDGTPVVRLTPTEITDVAKGETYTYEVLRRVSNPTVNELVIRLNNIKPGSNVRQFMSFRFGGDGKLLVEGYGWRADGLWQGIERTNPTAIYKLSRGQRFGN